MQTSKSVFPCFSPLHSLQSRERHTAAQPPDVGVSWCHNGAWLETAALGRAAIAVPQTEGDHPA